MMSLALLAGALAGPQSSRAEVGAALGLLSKPPPASVSAGFHTVCCSRRSAMPAEAASSGDICLCSRFSSATLEVVSRRIF